MVQPRFAFWLLLGTAMLYFATISFATGPAFSGWERAGASGSSSPRATLAQSGRGCT